MLNYDDHKKEYYKSGKIWREYYYLQGQYHRIDGPAYIYYFESGKIEREYYYLQDQCHRIDGPAVIYYNESGKIKQEYYLLQGKRHRIDGPADICYYESGKIWQEAYYFHGQEIKIKPYVTRLHKAKDKTKVLIHILAKADELRSLLANVLTEMFKQDLDKQVVENLKASVALC